MTYNGKELVEMTRANWDGKTRAMMVWNNLHLAPEIALVIGWSLNKFNSVVWRTIDGKDWYWCAEIPKEESKGNKPMYVYEFYLGDKYGDGHGKYEFFQYEMNITADEFNAALDKFNQEANTDCLNWFQRYEEYEWKPDMKEALRKIGLDYDDYTDDVDPDDPDYAAVLERTTYIDLMFNIVKHYVPHFEWKPYTFDKGPGHLCIEGKAYGLFE